ncbi:MAG: EamA family transporter [Bacillota bacterium]
MNAFSFALLAALFWAVGPVFARAGLVKLDPFTALSIRTLAVGVGLAVWALASGRFTGFGALDGRAVALLAAEGLTASMLGHLAYFSALKLGQVSLVSPVVSAFPAVAVLLAVLILGERLNVAKLAGLALIVAGLFVIRRG